MITKLWSWYPLLILAWIFIGWFDWVRCRFFNWLMYTLGTTRNYLPGYIKRLQCVNDNFLIAVTMIVFYYCKYDKWDRTREMYLLLFILPQQRNKAETKLCSCCALNSIIHQETCTPTPSWEFPRHWIAITCLGRWETWNQMAAEAWEIWHSLEWSRLVSRHFSCSRCNWWEGFSDFVLEKKNLFPKRLCAH